MGKTKRKFIIKVEYIDGLRQPEYVGCKTRQEAQVYIKTAIKPYMDSIKSCEISEE